jgi:hypothetical protein
VLLLDVEKWMVVVTCGGQQDTNINLWNVKVFCKTFYATLSILLPMTVPVYTLSSKYAGAFFEQRNAIN